MAASVQVPHLLVSPEWLAENLGDPTLRILDVNVWLSVDSESGALKAESGRGAWEEDHIPGSAFVNLGDLEDPAQPDLHMLPSKDVFARAMSQVGVGPGTHVVGYDAGAGMWATRLWWMLRVFGFDAVSVLDGGWRAWSDGQFPVSTEPPSFPPARFEPRLRPELVASLPQVASNVESKRGCLINAASPEMFRGEVAPGYRRGGRIPGSANVPYYSLLDPQTGRFRSPERLREAFEVAGGLASEEKVVTYCGNGFAATVDAFALALLGRADVAVYDGSLAEWAADPARPLETG
jgi:thiosulfate/3-mercaptopyruvate sulfurtransferase